MKCFIFEEFLSPVYIVKIKQLDLDLIPTNMAQCALRRVAFVPTK
jgi:hypothetical protein